MREIDYLFPSTGVSIPQVGVEGGTPEVFLSNQQLTGDDGEF